MIRAQQLLVAWGMACAWSVCAPAAMASPSDARCAEACQALLAQVSERLQDAPVVRGQFSQRKAVQGFKQPLQSSGDFVVARGKGMAWQVRQPFASTLIVKSDGLLSRGADGRVARQLRAQDEPVLRTVNAMLLAVMAADLAQLAQYFDVSGQARGPGWTLHLVPRDPMLAQWLQSVDLGGEQFVTSVQWHEAGGDRSQIQIHHPTAEQTLRAQDAALFD